jgi:hypothetical protein
MAEVDARQTVLVTGGTGFIGVPLCYLLRQEGYAVTVISRYPERAVQRLGPEVRVLLEPEEHSYHAVINLAGEPLAAGRWSAARKTEIRRSRIGTTEALLAHFKRMGKAPQVLVNGSAIGFYGNRQDEPLVESSPAGEGFGAQLCRDWEQVAEAFAALGTRVCRLRTGIVLGEGGGVLQQMLLPFKMGLGGPLGSGRQYMSWIHREDLLGLILMCLSQEDCVGPVNGTAPNPVTNREFARALGRALSRPAILPMPGFMLRLLMGEMADELLLAGQRVLPKVALARGYQYRYPELDQALAAIFQKKIIFQD